MEKRSKSKMEIFEQKYPEEELAQHPILCAEAVGYLKALREYFPSEQKWVDTELMALMLILSFHLL